MLQKKTGLKKNAKGSPQHFFGNSTFLWFRNDLSREDVRAYWRGSHAQLAGRNPTFRDYRQHHFEEINSGLWPVIPEVETTIPLERKIDGMSEITLKGVVAGLLPSAVQMNKRILADEVNIFARTILHMTSPRGGRWFLSGDELKIRFRIVVLIRRKNGISHREFSQFIHDRLGPTLSIHSCILELHTQVFLPWSKSFWDSKQVAHDYPSDYQFHASIVIGAESKDKLLNALHEISTIELNSEIVQQCVAIHAYAVANTYIYCKDGRPTLPQSRPEAKASLDPIKRNVALAPMRAKKMNGSVPFPKSVILPISGAEPEDVVVDKEGRIIYGTVDGKIFRMNPLTRVEELLCNTGGRPLGLEVMHDSKVLICDAKKGLLCWDTHNKNLETLVQFVEDIPLRFCSNVCVARDGTIWFTESTTRFDFEHYRGAFLEHRPSGRLLRRNIHGHVEVVLQDLYFPNGLTLNTDESAVLFVETAAYRLSRYWINGECAGQCEELVSNMPGFPDNISSIKNGRFWVAMFGNRNTLLDKLAATPAFLRKLIWKIPDHLQPQPLVSVWAIAFDENGQQLFDLQGTHLGFGQTTGVAESAGKLYFSTVKSGVKAILEADISTIVDDK